MDLVAFSILDSSKTTYGGPSLWPSCHAQWRPRSFKAVLSWRLGASIIPKDNCKSVKMNTTWPVRDTDRFHHVSFFSVAYCVTISRLWIRIRIPSKFVIMKKTPFQKNVVTFCNIYENNSKRESGFPATSCQIPLTSASSAWSNWYPLIAYIANEVPQCLLLKFIKYVLR